MSGSLPRLVLYAALLAVLPRSAAPSAADEKKPFGLDHRIPWTTSRIIGAPDPPLPYRAEPIFTEIDWQRPIYAKAEPGTSWLVVVQQGGEKEKPSAIVRVLDDPTADESRRFLEIHDRLVYGLTFHPDYQRNGYVFIFSNGPTTKPERKNRISRFTVDRETLVCNPDSEQIIIQWRSMGHDGGDLDFGQDGMLYISSGDGTSDSDNWITGQDVSDLLGGVLRIDVDHPTQQRAYSIPGDNPFVGMTGARHELWAYGLRNPWRMSVDPQTGHIWVGNNGQDLWETVHFVRRGENYGWSVYEGNHAFYLNRQRGPTAFVPPTIEHHHHEARSLTGGVVYHGTRLPELDGAYIYGDYSTGKIWGARHDGTRVTWQQELADTTMQIAGFAVSHQGDLVIVDHGGGLFRLVKSPTTIAAPDFPKRLSETGLFTSVKNHQVHPGLLPYSVNAPSWMDGARADRYIALPGDSQINYRPSRAWDFPDGAVLMQTLSVETAERSAAYRVETRLLTRQQGQWAAYSYRWNPRQDDAVLVPARGEQIDLPQDRGPEESPPATGRRPRTWRFPSRAECLSCHSRAVGFVLGLTELQMSREHDYGHTVDNQLRSFQHIGLFSGNLPKPIAEMQQLVDPYDTTQDLEARARSYLHVNCSSCHVHAGGGNARMELEFTAPRDAMKVISVHPQHDTFGIDGAMLVAPGQPEKSILYQRVSRRGAGQMPPLVSSQVDSQAVQLIHDWIKRLEPKRRFVRDWTMEDLLPHLDDLQTNRSFESGKTAFREVGCIQCHRLQQEGGGAGPDLTDRAIRLKPAELLESILIPSKKVAPEYATTVIQTVAGNVVEGRIERETDSVIVLRAGASFAPPTAVLKTDIEHRALSKNSIMPAGALNTLEKQEVLDLLAYVIAGGNADHTVFDSSAATATNP